MLIYVNTCKLKLFQQRQQADALKDAEERSKRSEMLRKQRAAVSETIFLIIGKKENTKQKIYIKGSYIEVYKQSIDHDISL